MLEAALPDAVLVAKAKAGDFAAFDKLISRYEKRVWTLARRMLRHQEDAEDVMQNTFLTAFENLDKLRNDERFGAWLMQIATRHAFRLLEKRKRDWAFSLDSSNNHSEDDDGNELPQNVRPEFIAEWRENPEELLLQAEKRQMIEQALSELPEKYRIVFLLRDVDGLSVRETAKALNITESNVKVRLLRARLQLREKLTGYFGDESKRLQPHNHTVVF